MDWNTVEHVTFIVMLLEAVRTWGTSVFQHYKKSKSRRVRGVRRITKKDTRVAPALVTCEQCNYVPRCANILPTPFLKTSFS